MGVNYRQIKAIEKKNKERVLNICPMNYSKKSDKPNKNQEKALEKFREFLDWEDSDGRS